MSGASWFVVSRRPASASSSGTVCPIGNQIRVSSSFRALQFGPESALAHFNLAVALEDQGDKSGALTSYVEALKRAPDFREAHCNLAQLYEQLGRRLDAIRHYAAVKRLGRSSRGVEE